MSLSYGEWLKDNKHYPVEQMERIESNDNDNRNKKCTLIDVAIPSDKNTSTKVSKNVADENRKNPSGCRCIRQKSL